MATVTVYTVRLFRHSDCLSEYLDGMSNQCGRLIGLLDRKSRQVYNQSTQLTKRDCSEGPTECLDIKLCILNDQINGYRKFVWVIIQTVLVWSGCVHIQTAYQNI